jgi:hypothetical protein
MIEQPLRFDEFDALAALTRAVPMAARRATGNARASFFPCRWN